MACCDLAQQGRQGGNQLLICAPIYPAVLTLPSAARFYAPTQHSSMASRMIVAACLLALAAAAQGRSLAQVGRGGGVGRLRQGRQGCRGSRGEAASSCRHTGQDNLDERCPRKSHRPAGLPRSCMGQGTAQQCAAPLQQAIVTSMAPAAHAPPARPPARPPGARFRGRPERSTNASGASGTARAPSGKPSTGAHCPVPWAVALRRPRPPEASTPPLGSTPAASPRRQVPPNPCPCPSCCCCCQHCCVAAAVSSESFVCQFPSCPLLCVPPCLIATAPGLSLCRQPVGG